MNMKKKEYTAPQAIVVTMATVLPVAVSGGEDSIERNNDSGDPNNNWYTEDDGKYWID